MWSVQVCGCTLHFKSSQAKHSRQLYLHSDPDWCASSHKLRGFWPTWSKTWLMNGRGGLGSPPWTVHQPLWKPSVSLPAPPKLKNCQLIRTSITTQSPRLTDLIASITFTLTEASLVRAGYSICAVTPGPAPFWSGPTGTYMFQRATKWWRDHVCMVGKPVWLDKGMETLIIHVKGMWT